MAYSPVFVIGRFRFRFLWLYLFFLVLTVIVKWISIGTEPLWLRAVLFHGVAVGGSTALLWVEGQLPALRAVLLRPLRGLALGGAIFAALATTVTLALHGLGLTSALPPLLGAVLTPLDLAAGPLLPGGPGWLVHAGLGAVAEEWVFRGALFWRWVRPADAPPAGFWRTAGVLLAVSAYFAALHWPQPPAAVLAAFLGSLVAGTLLTALRSLPAVGVLHVLYNWRLPGL